MHAARGQVSLMRNSSSRIKGNEHFVAIICEGKVKNGDLGDVQGQRAEHDPGGGGFPSQGHVKSPLVSLWLISSWAVAFILGPVPCRQGFVGLELGAGKSLVVGNYSSASVKYQPCHDLLPQGSAGLLQRRLAEARVAGDVFGEGSCGHRPPRAHRQGWMLPSLLRAGHPQLLPVLQETPFHPLDFCGGCSCGGRGISASWERAKAGTVRGKPPKRHLRTTGNADHFLALKADRVRTERHSKVRRQTL